jgi:cell division protein FtsZ
MEPAGVPVHTNGSAAFGDDDDDVDVPPFMRH